MKRRRRKQKKFVRFVTILLVIAFILWITLGYINGRKKENNIPEDISLPETTYSGMAVKNIEMKLLKDEKNNPTQTLITFDIYNSTNEKIETQFFEVVLFDSSGKQIAQMSYNLINSLEIGETMSYNTAFNGDVTSTASIKLVKMSK